MLQLITSVINGSENRSMLVDLRFDNQLSNQPVVIFVHGFKGFKDWGHFPRIGDEFAKAGFAFVSFNFSHNGTTVEQPTEFTDLEAFGHNNYHKELFDTESVIAGISEGSLFPDSSINRNTILLLGHSRGGGIAVIATSEDERVKGLATWASIGDTKRSKADFDEWMKEGVIYVPNARTNQEMPMYYQFVEDYFAQEERYDLQKCGERVKVPSLFIHGTNDQTVSANYAKQLHRWTTDSELLLIDGGDHTFGGRHPFDASELPIDTQTAIAATIRHFTM
jgi:dienelactone hydrolase